ncbi:MAG: tyrosine--tRNA ligase [Parcubacteria group bacterium]
MNKELEELLTRGVTEVIDRKNLEEKLASGKKLRIKLGIDPTSPNIHIGRATLLWKLRAFQDLGHTAVFIVGDTTGVVGDTSDKEAERPMLTEEEVKSNMKSYFDQAFKILDKEKTETHYNSEWLSKLGFLELARMASLFGLHEFEAREVISKRLEAGKRIALQEVLYPLMQGFDSVAVKANVEIGGTDQRFNLLAGRTIQPLYGQESQDIMTLKLLGGTDGRKMSSSWGNVINVVDDPRTMFGKIMSIKDELIPTYFELATRVSMDEIKEMSKGHPKEFKMSLAKEIVTLYHGKEIAGKAEEEFINTIFKGGTPEEVLTVKESKDTPLVEILLKHGLVSSKTEFSRLEKAGAIEQKENGVYRIGKHRFLRIEKI